MKVITRAVGIVRNSRRWMPLAIALAVSSGMPTVAVHAADRGNPASPGTERVSADTASDLRQLIDSHQLTELRTTYNASYGTSLLFHADKLSYYVSLFHDKEFLRVIQTDSYGDAESIYETFVAQTRKLAQVEIDATRLEAGNKYAQHLVAVNQQRLQNLQRTADYQQQQARQVAQQQQQLKQQAMAFGSDLHTTNDQLNSVKERISALEAQQANPVLDLPAVEDKPAAPAPSSSSSP